MVNADIRTLLSKLNPTASTALQNAAGLCVSRTNYEVMVEHLLLKALEADKGDLTPILKRFEIDPALLVRALNRNLDEAKAGNAGKPAFSPILLDLVEDAWIEASLDLGEASIRTGAILAALSLKPTYYLPGAPGELLRPVVRDVLLREFPTLTKDSLETLTAAPAMSGPPGAPGAAGGPGGQESFLARFCQDFTAQARAGKIDPVFGRDGEIRQIIDILGRRRKNNPILVGEPGVGKTAVIEGLALRIVKKDVPDMLENVTLLGLDMGALEAGAGMKGEFENRLRGVINEIKASEKPIVLFIDEAHTLIGAGGAAGGGDAANLLKPALARGELKTCAATTWTEYKKYFEKDPALARRFQLISLAEPDVATTELILEGLREGYEKSHGVVIRSDSLKACADYSDRYITGRFLPDKAIDLLDTTAARVKINLSAKPGPIEDLERAIQAIERSRATVDRDRENGSPVDEEAYAASGLDREAKKAELDALKTRYEAEKAAAEAVIAARAALHQAEAEADKTALAARLAEADAALAAARKEGTMVAIEVTPELVAQVVADWTGIPLGKVRRDESQTVLDLDKRMRERIKGQDMAVAEISKSIRAAKAGIKDPDKPLGVFLLVGPSGVGKTETALVLADLLFGGEKNAVTINMTEFTESHTVSRLIGSPPGYVGYGEGGMLTEAVRQKPYSVIVLDEAEKAHLQVMELFYQVFDKGVLKDGEGKEVSFKNAVLMLTSNLGSDVIQEMTSGAAEPVPAEALMAALRPILSQHFKPALLARMDIVPYLSLDEAALTDIARLKLGRLARTLEGNNRLALSWDQDVPVAIARRCTEVETGARNIESILSLNIMPRLSQTILESLAQGTMPSKARLTLAEDGAFVVGFTDGGAADAPTAAPAPDAAPDAGAPESTDATGDPAPVAG